MLELLSVPREEWPELKAAVLEGEGERLESQSDREVYGEYVTRQVSIRNTLVDIQREFQGSEQKNSVALVNCLRAQSEIYDKILKVGQDMGFVRREPERQEVGVAARVGQLVDGELQEWLEADRREFYRLYEGRGGGVPLLAIRGEQWGRSSAELAGAASGGEDGQGS